MKARLFTSLLVICCGFLGVSAHARSTPLARDLQLESSAFSELLYKALDLRLEHRAPDDVRKWDVNMRIYIQVAEGLKCEKFIRRGIGRAPKPLYTCFLLKGGGWSRLGEKTYGSGKSERLSVALFEALNVRPTKLDIDSDSKVKTIKLNVDDGEGGTERNLLNCIMPSDEDARLGIVPSCQLIDAL